MQTQVRRILFRLSLFLKKAASAAMHCTQIYENTEAAFLLPSLCAGHQAGRHWVVWAAAALR